MENCNIQENNGRLRGSEYLTFEQEQELTKAISEGREAQAKLADSALSDEDAGCLMRLVEDADRAKNELMESHFSLVLALAHASVGAIEEGEAYDSRINLLRKGWRTFKTISKFAHEHAVVEDRIQEGAIGLWEATLRAEPDLKDEAGRPLSFASHAANAIYDSIAVFSKTEESIEIPTTKLPRVTEDPVDAAIELTGNKIIHDILEQLGERSHENSQLQVRVLRLQFGLDGNAPMRFDQIAKEIGVHPERARRLSSRAIAILRGGKYGQVLRDALPVMPWLSREPRYYGKM